MIIRILPNVITLARIVVGLALVLSLFHWNSITLLSLIILIVVAITDFVDGYVARRLNVVTDWGNFLDPIADKIVIAGVFIYLGTVNLIDEWFLFAFLFREGVQIIFRVRSFMARSAPQVKTLFISKIKTGLCYLLCALLFYGQINSSFMDLLLRFHSILIMEMLIILLAYLGWLYYALYGFNIKIGKASNEKK